MTSDKDAPVHSQRARDYALTHRKKRVFELTPTPEQVRTGLRIRGGAGGTSAHLEDLGRSAAKITSAVPCVRQVEKQLAALVDEAGTWAYRIEADLEQSIAPWMPPEMQAQASHVVGDAQVAGAIAKSAAYDAGTGALLTLGGSEDLAEAVAKAQQIYLDANAANDDNFDAVAGGILAWQTQSLNSLPGLPGFGSLMAIARNVTLLKNAQDETSPYHELLVDDLANSILQLNPLAAFRSSNGSNMKDLSSDVTGIGQRIEGNLIREGSARLVPTPTDLPAVRTVQDAAAGVQAMYRRDDLAPGTIAIQKNQLTNDETAWVVMVPGTQGGVTETHGFDWLSNALLIKGATAPPTEAVQDAMRQAGIRRGEKVMMVGHSQGGLSSIDISNSGEFDVSHVVTLGTPTALQGSSPQTQYLAVEAEKDIVPGLDGAKNSDRPNQTTVRSEGVDVSGNVCLADVDPHSIEHYRDLLEEAEHAQHPSTDAFFSGARDQVFERPIPLSQGHYQHEPEIMLFEGHAEVVK